METGARQAKMREMLQTVFGRAPSPTAPRPSQPSDKHLGVLTEVLFGEIWSRPALEPRERSLVTLSALVALNREEQIESHIRGALNQGISKEKVLEVILHLAFYSGAPTAHSAFGIANEVFRQWDAEKARA